MECDESGRKLGSPDASGAQLTMANAVTAQNRTVKTVAIIRRKEEKFMMADDIANSCKDWTFSNTRHTVVAAKQVLLSHSM